MSLDPKIIKLLESISHSLEAIQKHVKSVADNRKPEERSGNAQDTRPLDVLISKFALPKTVEEYCRTHNNERPIGKWGWLRFSIEVIGVASVVLYVIVTARTLNEVKRQADTANRQVDLTMDIFRAQQRPWLKVSHKIISPLTFDIGGRVGGNVANMRIEHTFTNKGNSIALNVLSWEDVVPLGPQLSTTDAQNRLAEWCDGNRHPDPGGLHGPPIFQGDSWVQESISGPTMDTLRKYTVHDSKSSRIDGTVAFVLAGCVCYQFSLDKPGAPTHQTRFMYYLAKPEGDGMFLNVIPVGVAKELRLVLPPILFTAD